MTATLADLSLQVAKSVLTVVHGTATQGDTASLTDSIARTEANAYWQGGSLWLLSGPHAGEVLFVTGYTANKLTFRPLATAICAQQVETVTMATGCTGSGNARVVVTALGMLGSPKTLSVAVTNGDTAAVVAGKIRTALSADADVSAFFAVGGTGADIVLTAKVAANNDATMNLSVANDTCAGLTPVSTSTHTTAGSAARYSLARRDIPFSQLVAAINGALSECVVSAENTTLAGDGVTLAFPLPAGVSHVGQVQIETASTPRGGYPSAHTRELNGYLIFDAGFAPELGEIPRLIYYIPHPDLTIYSDAVDDELNLDWLRAQSIFNVLMGPAKEVFGDDPDYDVTTRLQVVNQALNNLAKYRAGRVRVKSAGVPD